MCTPAYCIPLYGSMTVISPEDRRKKNPQIYHLHDTAVVLMWTTRERSKTTCWVRDGRTLTGAGIEVFMYV